MNNPHRTVYVARLNRVIDYVTSHLAEELSLETLAAVANFSPYHFHRVFGAMMGETLADFIRRVRLEAAANQLLTQPAKSVLAIALDTGFASAEVFARGFKQHFGCTATDWRNGAAQKWSDARKHELSKIHQALRKESGASPVSNVNHPPMRVAIETLSDYRVVYLRYIGPYGPGGIADTWDRLYAWCRRHQVRVESAFGISLDNPGITEIDRCRYDACVAIDAQVVPTGEFGAQVIPGGRYACVDFVGTPETIGEAWSRFDNWLPDSGYVLDDRPIFELYDNRAPTCPADGGFACRLCAPVKPL